LFYINKPKVSALIFYGGELWAPLIGRSETVKTLEIPSFEWPDCI